jgi:ABC-2 type transport system permease protein
MNSTAELAPAYRVRGPSALAGDWRRFAYLTVTLAITDWKLRFFGSVLGYLWSLLRPLMLFGILYLVFSQVIRIGGDVQDYPIQLLVGVILFSYFADVTGGAVESVVQSELLVRKVAFPRMVIPLSVALANIFNLALNLVIVALFVALSGVSPRPEWLLLPIPVLLIALLAAGVAMLLSSLYVLFRDVRPIWDVVLQALFYATPIFYPIEAVAERSDTLAKLMMANPLAMIVQGARSLLLGPPTPSPSYAIGGWLELLVPLGLLAGLAALGFYTFNRLAPHVAEAL